jgi:uncharacterized membrane protein YraQ (UPF0718 family)
MIKQILDKNKLLVLVFLVYGAVFTFMPDKAFMAINNSTYYLIEMIQVLPVIFLLTVSIEALVPKEAIIKHFGEDSGFLGNIFSIILGSISAGPIYAAFPISKMLLSKGASIANIVIILSSWAVIKIPMLANEVKFLGFSFMIVRWILTVSFILIMAWITGKIIDKKDILSAENNEKKSKLYIRQDYCIGCGICAKMLPEVYEMSNNKAMVKTDKFDLSKKGMVIKSVEKCPSNAIAVNGID